VVGQLTRVNVLCLYSFQNGLGRVTRAKSRFLGDIITDAIKTFNAAETSILDVALSRHCAPSASNSLNQDPLLTSAPAGAPADKGGSTATFVTFSGPMEDGETSDGNNDEMMDVGDADTMKQRYSTM
jgi:hypothetical protein